MKLQTLKTYIKIYLKTRFIWLFKFFANALIFFNQKSDGSFCFYIDYPDFNNLTIKNLYLLPLISEVLDKLGRAKCFT